MAGLFDKQGRFRGSTAVATRPPQPTPMRTGGALRVVRPRLSSYAARSFKAGEKDRLTHTWTTTPHTIDYVTAKALTVLRARSREQVMNNDHARKFVADCRTNVAGPEGAMLIPEVVDPDGTKDVLVNEAIGRTWKEWGHPENCDVRGKLSWTAMQREFVAQTATDGEAIIIIREGAPAAGPFGFALELVDPERLDIQLNKPLSDGHYIKFGIEYDEWGRPVRYYFKNIDESRAALTLYGNYYHSRGHLDVPADKVIHGFLPEFVGQRRGFPWLSTALPGLQMLDAYREAAIVNARVSAAKMGFIYQENPETFPMGTDLNEREDKEGEIISDVEPGQIEQLALGQRFEGWDPTYPHAQFEPFERAMLRSISCGLLEFYPTFGNDMADVNYSSIRSGLQDIRENWVALQGWMLATLNRPVYLLWLRAALTTASLVLINGSALPAAGFQRFTQVKWGPKRWPYVDPEKEMKANERAIAQRTVSRSEIIRARGGQPEEVFRELAEEQRKLTELGIAPIEKAPGGRAEMMDTLDDIREAVTE